MEEDDLRSRIVGVENALSILMSVSQMSSMDIIDYFGKSRNADQFQQAVQIAHKELNTLKTSLYEDEVVSQKAVSSVLEAKNKEVIELQERISETAKQLSNSQLEVAALKRSISMQEAQNAQMTIENLKLKRLLGEKGDDQAHTDAVIDQMQQKNEELAIVLQEKENQLMKQTQICAEQKRKLKDLEEQVTKARQDFDEQSKKVAIDENNARGQSKELAKSKETIAELETQNEKLRFELGELKASYEESENKWKDREQALAEKNTALEEHIKSMAKGPTHTILQERIDKLKVQNEDLRKEIEKKDEIATETKERVERYRAKIEEIEAKAITTTKRLEKMNKKFVELNHNTQDKLRNLDAKTEQNFTEITNSVQTTYTTFCSLQSKTKKLYAFASESNRNYLKILENFTKQRNCLEYAIRMMAKLAGCSCLEAPSLEDVVEDPALLEQYYEELRHSSEEMMESQRRSLMLASASSTSRKPSFLTSTISTMSQLMNAMSEQMQEEHDQLMSKLNEHQNTRTFRRGLNE